MTKDNEEIKTFLDNAASINEPLSNDEEQFIRNIQKNRETLCKYNCRSHSGCYQHNDETKVILLTYFDDNYYDYTSDKGYDIILTRGKNYIHFETTEEIKDEPFEYNNKLNITIGQMGDEKNDKRSYIMRDKLSDEELLTILNKEQPAIAEIYRTYVPYGINSMISELREESKKRTEKTKEEKKEQPKKTPFDRALNEWIKGNHH